MSEIKIAICSRGRASQPPRLMDRNTRLSERANSHPTPPPSPARAFPPLALGKGCTVFWPRVVGGVGGLPPGDGGWERVGEGVA